MIARSKKLGLLLAAALSVALSTGCNDTLRQFIVPVPKTTGNPAVTANAVVLSRNPGGSGNGSARHIDVSGDSLAGDIATGPNPVFLGKASGRVFVINGNGTLTSYTAPLTTTLTTPPTAPQTNTVTLPASTLNPVGGGTSSSGNFYMTDNGSNDLAQVSASVLAVTQAIPVGTGPVAVAGGLANSKIYVVNKGSNNVSVISTIDNTVLKSIPVGANPIWGVMANNGIQVFIVNQGDGTAANPGSVSVIDTNLDITIPCTPGPFCNATTGLISVGFTPATSSPNFAFYESNSQRLYVSNTGENSISVIKADGISLGPPQTLPSFLANIHTSAPPVSVVALSDGSKAYAALGGCPSGTNHTNLLANLASCTGSLVSVIDARSLVELRTIQIGSGAVSVDAASDSSRVYAVSAHDVTTIRDDVHAPNCVDSNCLPGAVLPDRTFSTPSIYIIKTASDTIFAPPTSSSVVSSPIPSFVTPPQDPNCTPAIDPNFNDDVPMPCLTQVPFMVRIFP